MIFGKYFEYCHDCVDTYLVYRKNDSFLFVKENNVKEQFTYNLEFVFNLLLNFWSLTPEIEVKKQNGRYSAKIMFDILDGIQYEIHGYGKTKSKAIKALFKRLKQIGFSLEKAREKILDNDEQYKEVEKLYKKYIN